MRRKSLLLASTVLTTSAFLTLSAHAAQSTTTTTTQTTRTVNAQQPVTEAEVRELRRQIDALRDVLIDTQKRLDAKIDDTAKAAKAVSVKDGKLTIGSADGTWKISPTGRMHFDVGQYFQNNRGLKLQNGSNVRRAYIGFSGTVYNDWEFNFQFNAGGDGTEDRGGIASSSSSTTTPVSVTSVANGQGYLYEANITYGGLYDYKGGQGVKFDLGYKEPNFTFEDSMSSNDLSFIERPASVNIATSFGGSERRALLGGRYNNSFLYYNFYVTGNQTGGLSGGSQGASGEALNFISRLAVAPIKSADVNLHVGADIGYVASPNLTGGSPLTPNSSTTSVLRRRTFTLSDRPEFREDGTQFISTTSAPGANGQTVSSNNTGGALNVQDAYVVGLELAGNFENFGAHAEYFHYTLDLDRTTVGTYTGNPGSADFDGGYIAGNWIITGENQVYDMGRGGYKYITPAKPFSLADGTWGAVELAARISYMNLNDTIGPVLVRGGRQKIGEIGVNWYLNSNLRFMLHYLNVSIDRSAAITGAGYNFGDHVGQNYNALAFRSQFVF